MQFGDMDVGSVGQHRLVQPHVSRFTHIIQLFAQPGADLAGDLGRVNRLADLPVQRKQHFQLRQVSFNS